MPADDEALIAVGLLLMRGLGGIPRARAPG
jgi:hypothetical protein